MQASPFQDLDFSMVDLFLEDPDLLFNLCILTICHTRFRLISVLSGDDIAFLRSASFARASHCALKDVSRDRSSRSITALVDAE